MLHRMGLDGEYITSADDQWEELNVGERITVCGRLESVGYGSPGTIIITFVDWSSLVITCSEPRALAAFRVGGVGGDDVYVRVTRTEDGLDAHAMWKAGSVPVPCKAAT
jgi:hypothetical protein